MTKFYILSVIDHILDFEHIGSECMTTKKQKKGLSKVEEKILKQIALKGYKTRYQLFELAAESTVHYALKKFLDTDLLEIKETEPFRVPGKPKIFYGLTFRGLVQSLKIAGVKLHQIKNKDELLLSWIHRALEKDSELKISQQLFGLSRQTRDESAKTLEKGLIEYVKNSPEEVENWLKHFDLEYSDDRLIFEELTHYMLPAVIKNLFWR